MTSHNGGGRPQGQLERTLVALTIGMRNSELDRKSALCSTRAGEMWQQVQVEIAGQADVAWGFIDVPVTWEHPFVFSPLQRDPPFSTPIVTHHVEFTGTPSGRVITDVHVISWKQNDQGWYIGAVVGFGAQAAAGDLVPFASVLHLTFQGYGYPTDEELTT